MFVRGTPAARTPRATDLKLDLGEAAFHFPLLLAQLDAHGGVLGLQGDQSLPEPLDLGKQGLLGGISGRARTCGTHQEGARDQEVCGGHRRGSQRRVGGVFGRWDTGLVRE